MGTMISEGYPIDRATTRIFEPPQVNQDNTRTRYLGFIGSFITPEVATQRPWTKSGGLEVANPCLRYVKNFLRRGRITPLLRDTHDFLPYDFVKKTMDVEPLGAGWFAQQIPEGYKPPFLPAANGQGMLGLGARGGDSPYGMMVGRLALPGEQISSLLYGDDTVDRNFGRKGVVEFTSLYDHNYQPRPMVDGSFADPEIWKIERTIFPGYPVLPTTLDEIEALLNAASIHTQLLPIVDEFHTSLSEFRAYADIYIQNVHQQMRERAPNGYVRPYTAGDLVLLAQLGMERQDRLSRPVTTPGATDSELKEIFTQFLKAQLEEKQEAARIRQEQSTAAPIDASTMAAAPIEDKGYAGYPGASGYSGFSGEVLSNATPEGAELLAEAMADMQSINPLAEKFEAAGVTAEFKCACGQEAKSLAGLKAHERSCDQVNK